MPAKLKLLNGNVLKIIAVVSMLFDHIGAYFFPEILAFRIIGRLAFPIFAFMIAEGARYTKNKIKYISTVAAFGVGYQIILYILFRSLRLNILLTFTLALAAIYALDFFKFTLFNKKSDIISRSLSLVGFLGIVFAVYFLARAVIGIHIEYGFYGVMFAVFASAPSLNRTAAPDWLKKFDIVPVRLLCMCIPMVLYCRSAPSYQWFSFLALIPLLLYSEARGKWKLKYFFYIFYPAHMMVIFAIQYIISLIS